MTSLDEPGPYAVDAGGMFAHIERLGAEFEQAWAASATLPGTFAAPASITLAAMGGSASAADYVASLATAVSTVPVAVVRDYALPAHVGPRSLVIAVSYSGNTEETIACYRAARARGAATLCITTGGQLAAQARESGDLVWQVSYQAPPRAALSHMLALALRAAERAGVIAASDDDVALAARLHREAVQGTFGRSVPESENSAKQAARALAAGRMPILFAAEHLVAVARRGKNQFAENAKILGDVEAVPESTHNSIVALEGHGESAPIALMLESSLYADGNQRRFDVLDGMLAEAGIPAFRFKTSGASRLGDMLEATAWTDFVSCYLAVLRGVDPTPTVMLTRMREAVSRAPVV